MTLSQYLEIKNLGKLSLIESYIQIYSIYFNRDPVDVEKLSMKKIKKEVGNISNTLKNLESNDNYKESITTKMGELHFKSLTEMSLGEYIDLEYFLKDDKIVETLCLIYRKKNIKFWDIDTWEEWGDFIDKRRDIFLEHNITEIFGAIKNIINQKNKFIEKYKDLWNKDDYDYDEELKNENLTDEEKKIIEEERKIDQVRTSFNFEFLIHSMTGGDIMRVEEVLKMNVDLLFKFLLVGKQYDLVNKK